MRSSGPRSEASTRRRFTAVALPTAPALAIVPGWLREDLGDQCRATRAIKRRFGVKSDLDYLIGEKLLTVASAAKADAAFAAELPKFLAAAWRVFNHYEVVGYVATRRPAARRALRQSARP